MNIVKGLTLCLLLAVAAARPSRVKRQLARESPFVARNTNADAKDAPQTEEASNDPAKNPAPNSFAMDGSQIGSGMPEMGGLQRPGMPRMSDGGSPMMPMGEGMAGIPQGNMFGGPMGMIGGSLMGQLPLQGSADQNGTENRTPPSLFGEPMQVPLGMQGHGMPPSMMAQGMQGQGMPPSMMAQGMQGHGMPPSMMAQDIQGQGMPPSMMAQGMQGHGMPPSMMAQGMQGHGMPPSMMAQGMQGHGMPPSMMAQGMQGQGMPPSMMAQGMQGHGMPPSMMAQGMQGHGMPPSMMAQGMQGHGMPPSMMAQGMQGHGMPPSMMAQGMQGHGMPPSMMAQGMQGHGMPPSMVAQGMQAQSMPTRMSGQPGIPGMRGGLTPIMLRIMARQRASRMIASGLSPVGRPGVPPLMPRAAVTEDKEAEKDHSKDHKDPSLSAGMPPMTTLRDQPMSVAMEGQADSQLTVEKLLDFESQIDDIRKAVLGSFYKDLLQFRAISKVYRLKMMSKLALVKELERRIAMPVRNIIALKNTEIRQPGHPQAMEGIVLAGPGIPQRPF